MARLYAPLVAVYFLASTLSADITCEWRGRMATAPNAAPGCFAGSWSGPALVLPGNTDRMASDGLVLCRSAWNPAPKDIDIVYLMDNSGSMEAGETAGGYNTPPGDPYGIRDRMIRRAIRQQRATVDTGTAGFLSFFGLSSTQDYTTAIEIESQKIQRPLDISRLNPQGEANLNTILSKVWKHNPSEAQLPKMSTEAKVAKKALTYWSETLMRANSWFSPESAYVKTNNHAIVLVSDGAIGDWNDVQKLIPTLPPVYGIHLGGDVNAMHLKDLCAQTKGLFFMVSPTDTLGFQAAMFEIINILTGTTPRGSVKMIRDAQGIHAADTALAVGQDFDSMGNLKVRLDGDLSLVPGDNLVRVQYDQGLSKVEQSFPLQVAGQPLLAGNLHFTCGDPAGILPRPGAVTGLEPGPIPDRDALGKQRPRPDGIGLPPVHLFPAPAGR